MIFCLFILLLTQITVLSSGDDFCWPDYGVDLECSGKGTCVTDYDNDKTCNCEKDFFGYACEEYVKTECTFKIGSGQIEIPFAAPVQHAKIVEDTSKSEEENVIFVDCSKIIDRDDFSKIGNIEIMECSFTLSRERNYTEKFIIEEFAKAKLVSTLESGGIEFSLISLYYSEIEIQCTLTLENDGNDSFDDLDDDDDDENDDEYDWRALGESIATAVGTTVSSIICCFFVCCIPFIGIICCLCVCRNKKTSYSKNSLAPSKLGEKFVIVFTDIQNSTQMWEKEKLVMAEAMATHNIIIRKCIKRNKGYEVKTIGDAFMIVFKKPWQALKCCLEIQQNLSKAEWSERILSHDFAKELKDENGNVICKGIRVRIGMDFGVSQIEKTIGDRYDYNGPLINRSARIEASAAGGTILVSHDLYTELLIPKNQKKLNKIAFNWEFVGEKKMKGISESVRLYCAYQNGRKFSFLKDCDEGKSKIGIIQGNSDKPINNEQIIDYDNKNGFIEKKQLPIYVDPAFPTGECSYNDVPVQKEVEYKSEVNSASNNESNFTKQPNINLDNEIPEDNEKNLAVDEGNDRPIEENVENSSVEKELVDINNFDEVLKKEEEKNIVQYKIDI